MATVVNRISKGLARTESAGKKKEGHRMAAELSNNGN
jgi:hypothetical protein